MRAGTLLALMASIPSLSYLFLQLFFIYLSWGYRVRKARGAFEAQLRTQGLTKDQARAMSEMYVEMKTEIQRSLFSLLLRRPA
jgi:hypothetical protein